MKKTLESVLNSKDRSPMCEGYDRQKWVREHYPSAWVLKGNVPMTLSQINRDRRKYERCEFSSVEEALAHEDVPIMLANDVKRREKRRMERAAAEEKAKESTGHVTTEDLPAGEQPAGEQPAGDITAGDVTAGDQLTGEQPTAGTIPTGDQPAGEPTGDQPAGDGVPAGEGSTPVVTDATPSATGPTPSPPLSPDVGKK